MVSRLSAPIRKIIALNDPIDTITLDVPLLMRLLEYAREDAQSDMDLHNVITNALKHKHMGPLGMEHYNVLIAPIPDVEEASDKQAINGYSVVPKERGWLAINGKTIAQTVMHGKYCFIMLQRRDGDRERVTVPDGQNMTPKEISVWLEAWLKANPRIISELEM